MASKAEMNESWKFISRIIGNKTTFDIGFMHRICNLLEQDLEYEQSVKECTQSIIGFLGSTSDKSRNNPEFPGEYLALIVVDSVIFNIYARHKSADKLRLNSSYSMSMSQMSMNEEMSGIGGNEGDLKVIISLVEALASNSVFFKKLKLFFDRNHHREKNHHYLQNLLETIDYILNKEKLSSAREKFTEQKEINFAKFLPSTKKSSQDQIDSISKVFFSNQLNKVVFLLTESPEEVYFALSRVYFVGKKHEGTAISATGSSDNAKYFKNCEYCATDMVYNLNKTYVESFASRQEIFQESKNPLFILNKVHLLCFFLPVFRRFCQIVLELSKNDFVNMSQFYKINEQLLEKYLIVFIDDLPLELVEYLNSLYRIIERSPMQSKGQGSILPIKRLFLYSFLADPTLIKEYYSPVISLEKFEEILNYVINLFFVSSHKKYTTSHSMPELAQLIRLSEAVATKFEEKVISFDQNYIEYITDENVSITSYYLEQPILNHDFQLLAEQVKRIEFTPKDFKRYEMRKESEIFAREMLLSANQSPDPKSQHRKDTLFSDQFLHQSAEYVGMEEASDPLSPQQEAKNEGNVDLMTWMSIGGTHDYSKKVQVERTHKIRPKKKFVSFDKDKVREINRLYEEYSCKNIF